MRSNSKIIITAQQRALRRRLWEHISPKRIMESVFRDTLGRQMEQIRDKDERIRDRGHDIKKYLKSAKSALKQRKYLDLVHWVHLINDAVHEMAAEAKDLEQIRQEQVDDFYGEYSDADLDKLNTLFNKPVTAAFANQLMKTAGVMDWFGNKRERAAKFLEQMYSKTLRERHRAMMDLYRKAEGLVNNVLERLKDLDKARTSRDVSAYIDGLTKIGQAQIAFNNEFRNIYNQHVKPIVERLSQDRSSHTGPGAKLENKDTPGVVDTTGEAVVPTAEEKAKQEELIRQRDEALKREREGVEPPPRSGPVWFPVRSPEEAEKAEQMPTVAPQGAMPSTPQTTLQEQVEDRSNQFAQLQQQYEALKQQYEALKQKQHVPNIQISPGGPVFPSALENPHEAHRPTQLIGPPSTPREFNPQNIGIHTDPASVDLAAQLAEIERRQQEWANQLNQPLSVSQRPISTPAIEVTEDDLEKIKEDLLSNHPEAEDDAEEIISDVKTKSKSPSEAAKELKQLENAADKINSTAPSEGNEIVNIAKEIQSLWTKPTASAQPYLEAMVNGQTDEETVKGFLSNAGAFRAEGALDLKNRLRTAIGLKPARVRKQKPTEDITIEEPVQEEPVQEEASEFPSDIPISEEEPTSEELDKIIEEEREKSERPSSVSPSVWNLVEKEEPEFFPTDEEDEEYIPSYDLPESEPPESWDPMHEDKAREMRQLKEQKRQEESKKKKEKKKVEPKPKAKPKKRGPKAPPIVKNPNVGRRRKKAEDMQFINQLSKTKDPIKMAMSLLAYSEYMENVDPQISAKLITIAESLF